MTKVVSEAPGGKNIPQVTELPKLLEEKKQYKAARQEMIDFQAAKRNENVILGMDETARKNSRTGSIWGFHNEINFVAYTLLWQIRHCSTKK